MASTAEISRVRSAWVNSQAVLKCMRPLLAGAQSPESRQG
jgi:hypothetical protein